MPQNDRETCRLKVLSDLAILDSAPEREFQELAELGKKLLGTKIALLSLIDADRQWFKAKCGIDLSETPRAPSFCSVVAEADAPLIVADMHADPRFAGNPFVVGEPHIRFYAGIPVHARMQDTQELVAIGSLCVMDQSPREIRADELASLRSLAAIADALIDARATALRAGRYAEERLVAMERSERERRRLKQAERIADIGSWRLSLGDNNVEWSDGGFAIHELPLDFQPPVEKALDHYPEPDRTKLANAIARTVETGEPFHIEADFFTAKGNKRRVRTLGEIEMSKGIPVALIGVFQDITERHRMDEALRLHACTDDLTGLANRAEFYRVLEDKLDDGKSSGAELAVLLIDLDGFKQVNDTLGHAAGDDVLRRVGALLRSNEMARCLGARLGGDEFAVIVPSTDRRKDFRLLLEYLLAGLRIDVAGEGGDLTVTGSIGVAWSNPSAITREELLRRADTALYEVKRTRKGTARTYGAKPALSVISE